MNISILIPTFNGLEKLKKHLPTVLAAAANGDELILGDDASTDQTVEWLKAEFNLAEVNSPAVPDVPKRYQSQSVKFKLFEGVFLDQDKKINVKLVASADNLRYAATVNLCVPFCSRDHFFLVNNDVSCNTKTLNVLKDNLENQQLFAVGCLEYPNQTSTEKSGKNKLWFERGIFQHSKADSFETGETAWVSGGSGLFSKQKWLDLGGFDLQFYPAYWEDIDICFQARMRGWKVWFDAEAVVYHHHQTTHNDVFGQAKISQISWKNANKFTWKNASLGQRFSFVCWYPYWLVQRCRGS